MTTDDRKTQCWEVTAGEPFWSHLGWAAVELGCEVGRAVGVACTLLIFVLRELRAGHRVVVMDEAGEVVSEVTAGYLRGTADTTAEGG